MSLVNYLSNKTWGGISYNQNLDRILGRIVTNTGPLMIKGKRYPVEILTDAEVKSLINACSNRWPTGIRNRALIVILYRAGLRIGEALALKPKDINFEAGTIRILSRKGGEARTVALDPVAFTFISRWLDVRKARGIGGYSTVFCTLEGGIINPSYIGDLFKRIGKRANIEKRVHPHQLRHTMAAQLAQEGVPVNAIQKQLGHSSLVTTIQYLDRIQPQELIDIIKARKWD